MDIVLGILLIAVLLIGIVRGMYLIYETLYFKSEKFLKIKSNIQEYTKECNDLNEYIEGLKNSYVDFKQIDYGQANYTDSSLYNYKRPELKKIRESNNIYNCSLNVCRNAQQQPFKYICKYFNIKESEENLSKFESVLNDFSAAEQGLILLKNQRDEIMKSISKEIPGLIRDYSEEKLLKNLGFDEIDFSQLYFPQFTFRYVSPGGNSSMKCEVVFDVENLDRFIKYLSQIVKFRKSVAGQRALMTSALREKIKIRDNYTCKMCGLSIEKEPNLLLEIDHIIPLSKNGLTTEDNLQTLCWKCNRSKGSKILKSC